VDIDPPLPRHRRTWPRGEATKPCDAEGRAVVVQRDGMMITIQSAGGNLAAHAAPKTTLTLLDAEWLIAELRWLLDVEA
jgi:hypothetical protein